jgi:hypothetical protein
MYMTVEEEKKVVKVMELRKRAQKTDCGKRMSCYKQSAPLANSQKVSAETP